MESNKFNIIFEKKTSRDVFSSLKFLPLVTLVCTHEGSLAAVEEEPEKTIAPKCIPNPANNYTNIRYQLPEEGQVFLESFDLSNYHIAVLQSEKQSAGATIIV